MTSVGPLGRLGAWTASQVRLVVVAWIVLGVGFGVFAPRAEHALSGAGWEASGSESVAARAQIEQSFGGQSAYALMVVVHGEGDLDPALDSVREILDAIVAIPAGAILAAEFAWARNLLLRMKEKFKKSTGRT